MKILDKDDIHKYLSRFAGRDEQLSAFLNLTLFGPLQHEFSCLKEIKSTNELPHHHLHRKFNTRSDPWYKFHPTEQLDRNVRQIASWLMDFISHAGQRLEGNVVIESRDRLRKIKFLDEALARTSSPLMSEEEINEYFSKRVIHEDEVKGHLKWVLPLPNHHHLFRITTMTGIDRAGKRADNCLDNPKRPNAVMPHRRRVLYPDRWQYFTVRDINNQSVITLMVDFAQRSLEYEGNGGKDIPPYSKGYMDIFKTYIMNENPGFFFSNGKTGYYGTLQP